jgi:Ca2+-binding RTX toxin-like protein
LPYIEKSFDALVKQYEGKFAIETYYKDTFSDVHYDLGIDEFVIDDEDAFYEKVATYFNSANNDIKSKLYLASIMNMQEGEFLHFDAARVLQNIAESSLEATISDIYADKINFQYFKEDGYYKYDNDLIYATDTDDTVTFNTKQTTTIIAGKGDDVIVDNAKGDTTYVYNLGDGSDTIYDRGGNDTLKLKDIAYEDVTITTEVADLLITINSDNSTIRVKDWMKLDNTVEHILFAGDTQVDLNDILFPKTEGDDYIEATNTDDTIDALGGDDTVTSSNGNDIIFVSKTNKNPTQKPLNNISEQKISIFAKKQDIIIDCFKKVA